MDRFAELDPQLFLYAGVFLGVIILFEGMRQMVFSGDAGDRNRSKRVRKLTTKMGPKSALAMGKSGPGRSLLTRIPFFGPLPGNMRQAGMTMKPWVFMALCALASGLVFVPAMLAFGPLLAAGFAALTGMVIPMGAVDIMRKTRVKRFTEQLPDALELMMRGLRVGHPLKTTIETVAKTMPDPISTEFEIMADQITYGDELTEAMFSLADRIDQEDMHYLAVSVSIQHGTGGNLAKMLQTLSKVIRRRFAMRRKIKALSAEGRISAIILSSLPILMYGGTMLTAPHYYTGVQDDPLFMPIAAAIVILVVSNGLMMRKLVNFKV